MPQYCVTCADKGILTPLDKIYYSKLLTRCPVCCRTVDLRYGAITLKKLLIKIETSEQYCRALRAELQDQATQQNSNA
jgi:hypothetical protein